MSYSGKFKDKNNNLHPVTSVLYGTCDTAAATAAKVVTCTDFDALMTGVTIRVKFANANTAANPTVNINSTGAKSVYRFGSTAPVDGNSWNAGEVVELVYDGTSFFMTNADNIGAKQDATDNNLTTIDKTVVGGINELKSGFTTLDNEVNGDATVYPYADVITIEDAVPANLADCTVKIEPVQDLHGYDHPWVGGAWKNKLPLVLADIKALNITGTWSGNEYTINGITFTINTDVDGNVISVKANGTNNGTSNSPIVLCKTPNIADNTDYILNGCPTGGGASLYYIQYTNNSSVDYKDTDNGITIRKFDYTTFPNSEVKITVQTGVTVSNIIFYPMISLATEADATFAPYTNICPITGHTEASVLDEGKNLVSAIEQGGFGNDGADSSATNRLRSDEYISVIGGSKYTVSNNASLQTAVFYWDEQDVTTPYQSSGWQNSPYTFEVPANAKYVRIMLRKSDNSDLTPSDTDNVQIEYGEAATAYTPYVVPHTYTLALGDTIYGGTVDFDSGVMTVDRAIATENDFTTVNGISTGGLYYATYSVSVANTNGICNMLEQPGDPWSSTTPCFQISQANGRIRVYGNFTTLQEFQTAFAGLQICYYLATPTTIQLTPEQIQLLQGTNTLTASTGDISVTVNGVSGSIGAVQEQVNGLAEEVADALADKTDTDMVAADFNDESSYTAGNYCVQDGKLYRFKNNHSGAWSAADVEEVKITGELSAIKSGLTDVNDVIDGVASSPLLFGVYPNGNSYGNATITLPCWSKSAITTDYVKVIDSSGTSVDITNNASVVRISPCAVQVSMAFDASHVGKQVLVSVSVI